MARLHFENDYHQGIHPDLLSVLINSNTESLAGYGGDPYSQSAITKIQEACACPEAQISFLTGGTQTNQIIINSLLKSYEGVIAADTGHISTHEAGAIEFSGHKVIALPHTAGKLTAEQVKQYLIDFYADANHEHMVFPGMVYISHPTEYGTLYTHAELTALATVCQDYQMPLFMDGARLGYALGATSSDVTLTDIAQYCDVFYIGGTKLGAIAGEAVVFTKNNQPKHWTTIVKQHGALLAKSRLLGVQFDRLFTDNLYQKIGQQAVSLAEALTKLLKEKGYQFYIDSPTNQQFLIVNNQQLEQLSKTIAYSFWEKYDDTHTVIRLATSWSTTPEDIAALATLL